MGSRRIWLSAVSFATVYEGASAAFGAWHIFDWCAEIGLGRYRDKSRPSTEYHATANHNVPIAAAASKINPTAPASAKSIPAKSTAALSSAHSEQSCPS